MIDWEMEIFGVVAETDHELQIMANDVLKNIESYVNNFPEVAKAAFAELTSFGYIDEYYTLKYAALVAS